MTCRFGEASRDDIGYNSSTHRTICRLLPPRAGGDIICWGSTWYLVLIAPPLVRLTAAVGGLILTHCCTFENSYSLFSSTMPVADVYLIPLWPEIQAPFIWNVDIETLLIFLIRVVYRISNAAVLQCVQQSISHVRMDVYLLWPQGWHIWMKNRHRHSMYVMDADG